MTGNSGATPALRLGVLASGNGSNFQALAEAIQAGEIPNAEIGILIYNNPDALVRQRAERLGISTQLLNHRAYPRREDLDHDIVSCLKEAQVDWVVMAGWMRRVTEVLINTFPNRILNLHPSLLPSFPGIRAVEQALDYGVKVTGCTVHIVRLAVDSGPIVCQAAVPVQADDTAATLAERIHQQEHRILVEAVALVASGRVQVGEHRVRVLPTLPEN
ncbi:phosphoribosylglycinamide formyltransferase [Leptolyngbya sp. FACHB-261]|uniref:phosphoribosylglycinamide formyltransferase n=1 Tax=Leptolyngbya sp. FACHB-261 TaxID=2692806 RepID=UPI0016861B5D|nr:phosphoribosylglycinamide formyltransferase [Leptolyngbya sp. FACHB-261]MBD2100897.1 phosphoribosylglycinamide formyltransferase [Leptolyngbya sp. FACHB-261]